MAKRSIRVPEITEGSDEVVAYSSDYIIKSSRLIEDLYSDLYQCSISTLWHTRDNTLVLHHVIVPERLRGNGIGTRILEDLMALARKYRCNIALTPSDDFGGNKKRLEKWYRSLGFKTLKGGSLWEELVYRG